MADIAHTKTDQKLEEMENRLSAIYSRAEKEIGKRWKEYLAESQAEIDELQKAYDLAKKSGDAKEIRKAGIALSRAKKDRTLMDNRFKALTETTAAQLANVNKTALAYVNGQLPEVYSINYNALEPSVDGVGGYSFALIDADTVKNLATTDKSLLPYKQLDEKTDIRWNVKKMNAEVLQGILQGEPMDKIAGRLSKVTDMNATAAIRNARTMVTGAENKGRQDSYARATADGIILAKEWISTNDSRTRHSHAVLDGAIVDQDKKFDNGLMYPGDPSGRPEEVYNCRCTVAAVVKGFKKAQVQKAMEQPKVFREEDYRSFETGEQTNDFFYYDDEKRGLMARKKSAHGQWTSGLSQDEARAIGQYCADGYYDINNYWRKYGDWQDINAERVKHQTEMLDGVIARYDLKEPIKVYRAIQPEAFESYWDDIQRIVGTEYTDAGFMSTSPIKTSTAVNKDCIMELFIPSGKGRGAYVNNVSGFQDEEYEFLLARDSKFRVIGAEETEDKLILKMEWIGNGQ